MKSVPPSVALLQYKGDEPSWVLKGTEIILSLLKNSCVRVPTWPYPSSGELNFVLLRKALTNGLEQAWSMTNGLLHGSCDNLAALLLHYFLCPTPSLILIPVSLARCTGPATVERARHCGQSGLPCMARWA